VGHLATLLIDIPAAVWMSMLFHCPRHGIKPSKDIAFERVLGMVVRNPRGFPLIGLLLMFHQGEVVAVVGLVYSVSRISRLVPIG